jgi:hypothetical protein
MKQSVVFGAYGEDGEDEATKRRSALMVLLSS